MKLRLQITKESGIRFISHLEYQATLEKAIRRAKLPVAYSQGYNPHMKFSLASALGVGITSDCEFVEIELAEDIELKPAMAQLSKALPMGIHIKNGDMVEKKAPKLMASAAGAEYLVLVPCQGNPLDGIHSFNVAEEVIFAKPIPKGRGKTKEIDVKKFIPVVAGKYENNLLELKFSCKITLTGSMKASELLLVLRDQFQVHLVYEAADIRRIALYGLNDLGHKRPLLNTQQ
jgi:radical SAM-linked protein